MLQSSHYSTQVLPKEASTFSAPEESSLQAKIINAALTPRAKTVLESKTIVQFIIFSFPGTLSQYHRENMCKTLLLVK